MLFGKDGEQAQPPQRVAADSPRERELAYLRRLELGELQHVDLYTPLAGTATLSGDDTVDLPACYSAH